MDDILGELIQERATVLGQVSDQAKNQFVQAVAVRYLEMVQVAVDAVNIASAL